MRIHFLQHAPLEDLDELSSSFFETSDTISATRLYEYERLPDVTEIDLLVVLGGPMSVNDTLPWLETERRFIASCIASEKAVTGICLGAQLIASVLGARVYTNHKSEFGWFDVHSVTQQPLFPRGWKAFHWHRETFSIPQGATLLASSALCTNQAFTFGDRVIAMQFHPEITPTLMAMMETHGGSSPCCVRAEPEASEQTFRMSSEILHNVIAHLRTKVG